MLTLRSLLVAVAIGVGALRGQIPGHASAMPQTPNGARFQVAQHGDEVHVTDRSTYYLRSIDGGRTWPQLPQWLPLAVVSDFACGPGLAVAAGFVGILNNPFIVRSTDGGATWQGPVDVSPGMLQFASYPMHVHVDGANVLCVWLGQTWPGYTHVWTSRSTDGGVTWQSTPTQLSAVAVFGGLVDVLAEGASIHVFWHDGVTQTEYQQVSADGGSTWLPAPRARPGVQVAQQVVRDGNDLFAVSYGATLHQSHDGGVTWTSAAVPGMQGCFTVACAGQTVVVGGFTNLPSGFAHVLNVSADGGATWLGSPWTASSSASFWLRVHAIAGNAYAHFGTGSLATDLLLHSDDLGATWRVLQHGVTTFVPGPLRNINHIRLQGTSSHYDAVFVGTGYTRKGTSLPGTGGIAPQLRLDGLPHLGATTSFTVDAAVGGALGALGFAFAAPAATPFGPATIWLQGPLVLATLACSGAPNAPGAGNAALPVAIPASPSLVGANLTAQALLLDAGAAAGFTVTNAIEVWMR